MDIWITNYDKGGKNIKRKKDSPSVTKTEIDNKESNCSNYLI